VLSTFEEQLDDLRAVLDAIVDELEEFLTGVRPPEVDTAGDGFLATFDGPARAIRCATGIVQRVRGLGLDVRIGLHAGECEVIAGKIGGAAVHIGARVAVQARPGEVLVTSTVKDLVVGSGFRFADRGRTVLKGVPDEWRLFAVDLGRMAQ
jgi:class 3 adenylate cyclase